jgi:hypothetical protein
MFQWLIFFKKKQLVKGRRWGSNLGWCGGYEAASIARGRVEACNRSWPHDGVKAWERCFVAPDFNGDS